MYLLLAFKKRPPVKGKVFIPIETRGNEIPTDDQVLQHMAKTAGGRWKVTGGWRPAIDAPELYVHVHRVKE